MNYLIIKKIQKLKNSKHFKMGITPSCGEIQNNNFFKLYTENENYQKIIQKLDILELN